MTTGRINQIANVISPREARGGPKAGPPLAQRKGRDVETPRSKESS